jgi:competence protein ComEC
MFQFSRRAHLVFGVILLALVLIRLATYNVNVPDGKRVRISGTLKSEPVAIDSKQRIAFSGIKIYLPMEPPISYGSFLTLEGTIEKGVLKDAKLIKFEEPKNIFYRVRNKMISFYTSALPQPHSALVAGAVLGSKSSLPNDFWNDLKATGTAHVVVASGMNVSLIAGFILSFLLTFLKRKWALIFSISAIWLYCYIVGFQSPIVRATIMASVAFMAQLAGRVRSGALRTLFVTGVIMLIILPSWFYDIGFWLSFVATGSLLTFNGRVTKLLSFIPEILRGDLAATVSAQIGVAPLLLLYFGQFNLLSPVINALILWTIPLITIIGALAGVMGLWFPFLGKMILYLAYPLTFWFVGIINLFS